MKRKIKRIIKRNKFIYNLVVPLWMSFQLFVNYKYKKVPLSGKLRMIKKYFVQVYKGLPRILAFEPVSTCPLNCEFCILKSLRTFEKRKKVRMSFEEFKKIIDDISFFCTEAHFSGGEPILNNDIFKMFRYCREKDIFTLMATNAQLLDEEKIKSLLKDPPNIILLSFESPDKEVYEKIRKQGKFERLEKNIRDLISEKKKTGQFYPLIILQMVLTKVNQYQEKDYHSTVSAMGADFSSIKALGVWPEGDKEYVRKMEQEYIIDEREHPISRHRLDENGKLIPKKPRLGECPTRYTAYIGSGGEIYPCWYIVAQDFSPGNAVEQNFVNVWNGKTYKNFRKKMFDGTAYPSLCDKCIGINTKGIERRVKK